MTARKTRLIEADRLESLPQLAVVEWVDSVSPGAGSIWTDNDRAVAGKLCACVTVGFILKETRDALTLAASVSPNQSSGIMTIPKRAILQRSGLKAK